MKFIIKYDPTYDMYNVYELTTIFHEQSNTYRETQVFLTSKSELKEAHHYAAIRLDYKEFTVAEVK